MPANKVLIITYLFPPSGGVGPPRYVAYTRHLHDMGFEVHVLTAKNPNTPLFDPTLLTRVPPDVPIHRVYSPGVPYAFRDRIWKRLAATTSLPGKPATPRTDWSRALRKLLREAIQNFFSPDVQKFWVPLVRRRTRRLLREHGIGCVILNTPPFSLYGLIEPLKREFPHVKWITEVRDDWLGYYLDNFDDARTEAKRHLAVRLEASGVGASDYVVAVTPAQRDSIQRRYPNQPDGKFLYVSNGFDADLFSGFQPRREGRQNLVIGYFGSLYASPPYNPKAYLEAVESLPEPIREQVETRFIGRIAREVEPLLQNRKARITRVGFLPQREGVRMLEECDYLLLLANEATTHAGKLFDYLATGLPILTLTTPIGEMTRIMRETGAGIAVDGSKPEAIREALLDCWARLRGHPSRFPQPNQEAIQAFERRKLTERLVTLTGLGQSATS